MIHRILLNLDNDPLNNLLDKNIIINVVISTCVFNTKIIYFMIESKLSQKYIINVTKLQINNIVIIKCHFFITDSNCFIIWIILMFSFLKHLS